MYFLFYSLLILAVPSFALTVTPEVLIAAAATRAAHASANMPSPSNSAQASPTTQQASSISSAGCLGSLSMYHHQANPPLPYYYSGGSASNGGAYYTDFPGAGYIPAATK